MAIAACSAPAPRPDRAMAARGAAAIELRGCGSCHVIPGIEGAEGQVGPSLAGLGRRVFIAGRLPNSVDSLARWIMDPQYYAPGVAMPDLDVGEAEAMAIATYLDARR